MNQNGENTMRLSKTSILVIGATGGIGSVLSRAFHAQGGYVGLFARTKDKLDSLAFELGTERAISLPGDATSSESIRDALSKLEKVSGAPVKLIVITAGTWMRTTADHDLDTLADDALKAYNSFLLPTIISTFVGAQYLKNTGGLIAHISSHAGIRSDLPGNLLYGPMKAGSSRLIHGMQYELQGTPVRLVDIVPAIVNTRDNESLLKTEEMKKRAVQPESIAQWIIDHINDPYTPASIWFDSDVILD